MSVARRIIPCLDVHDGRVVKGVQFLDLRDAGDPVEIAARYDAEGADEVTFLDISASHEGRALMLRTVEATARKVFIPLTVGGGIRVVDDIRHALGAGADKTSLNTAAIADPAVLGEGAARFGSQCVVVAIDAKAVTEPHPLAYDHEWARAAALDGDSRWEVYTHGGRRPTGLDAVRWAEQAVRAGAGEVLLTSMDRDGTKSGYDLALTRAVSDRVPVPVIASGGAGTAEHLVEAAVEGHADGLLAASIFHFREVEIADVKRRLREAGVPVREERR